MTTSAIARSTPRAWHWSLWVLQLLLAAFFLMAGFAKATQPLATLPATMPWVADVPGWLVRFIGFSELAGALGLVLPAATRIAPALTPLAALGLSVVMVLACGFHLSRDEPIVMQLVVGVVAGVVAWGRFRKAPIAPRLLPRN